MIRRAVLLVAALLGAATLLGAPASAEPVSSCSATSGTIVAVDFGHWGGQIVRGCDTGNPKRGIDLLTDEGFRTTGTQHDGPQFVCRIGNQAYNRGTQYPTPADDPCVVTPPASAYWSYWLAAAGSNRWSYSQNGAYANTPRAGEVQLWIFGRTNIEGSGAPTDGFPTCTPNSLRPGGTPTSCTASAAPPTHAPTSAPTSRHSSHAPPTRRATHSAGSSTAAHPAATSNGARSASSSASSASSASAPASGAASSSGVGGPATEPAPSGGAASAGSSPIAIDAKPASTHTDTGSVLPLVLGVSLAVLFAIGGGWIVRQRRRSGT